MAECPKCSVEIGKATYCGCGWGLQGKRGKPARQEEPRCGCAFMGCDKTAIVKQRVSTTAWSNVCERHYDELVLRKAEETCVRMGLRTTEEKRRYVLERMEVGPFRQLPYREPGQDDEERVA